MRSLCLLPSAVCSFAVLLLPLATHAQSVQTTGSVVNRFGQFASPTPNPAASWLFDDLLYVGNSTTESGTLSITGGGTFRGANLIMGRYNTSEGTVTVSGAGSTLNNITTTILVGYTGKGTFNITNGGTVFDSSGSYIAHSSGSEGEATVSGSGSKWTTNTIAVGNGGRGTLTITNGGVVSSSNGFIGYLNGAEGEASVSGAGSTWEITNSFYLGGNPVVGSTATGNLTIENGGTVTVANTTRVYSGDTIDLRATGTLQTNTLFSSGIVNVSGILTALTGVTVASGGVIGGGGLIEGDLTMLAGAKLQFIPGSPLSVTGDVSLDSTFGVDDLLGLSYSTATGTYSLFDTTETSFSLLTIQNWGIENAYDLGGGKSAYFGPGGLSLTVIPEPSSAALLLPATVAAFILLRRRKRSA